MDKDKFPFTLAAGCLGAGAGILTALGNPSNMGLCLACFIRDTVGALGLHGAAATSYIRPEVCGIVLGSFLLALYRGEFRPKGGSAPLTRFVLGFWAMIGCLMFLGCPLRMVLRLAGGDLNAVAGLAGFALGIAAGVFFLNRGYSLQRAYKANFLEGSWLSLVQVGLLVLLFLHPAFIRFSTDGPGSLHAPVVASLALGLAAGAAAQRGRLCFVGGIRDWLLFKDGRLLKAFCAIFLGALLSNLFLGAFTGKIFFHLGFEGQPIAHNDALWNALGLGLAGFACLLLGGCPLRQLVLAGEGAADSAAAVLGLAVGAACAHNFGLAASAAGPTLNGKAAVLIGLAITFAIACFNTYGKDRSL